MTVRLLVDWKNPADGKQYLVNNLLTTDAGTETGLVNAKLAASDLTGGTAWVAPPVVESVDEVYPLSLSTDSNGNTVLVGADGVLTIGNEKLAQSSRVPKLVHYFPPTSLSGANVLRDVVTGDTLTAAQSTMSLVDPAYVTLAAANSGNLTKANPWQNTAGKPLFVMAMFTTVGLGQGITFSAMGKDTIALKNGVSDGITNAGLLIGLNGDEFYDHTYAGTVGFTEFAIGMLYDPTAGTLRFLYYDGSAWVDNASPETSTVINTELLGVGIGGSQSFSQTSTGNFASAASGVRKIFGIIMYNFDSVPLDYKAAMIEMRSNWLAGKHQPYSGW